ncbi:hypothetical protein M23134_02420 [Microscilla marina ATCC 23134]|uniref:Transposase n=1 Tax=Microscilla marina ATCC 23134 TaxID=313606 RepID=A1ZKK3_MICM2|nr:hypothetical protein M23134_02420 [Microscilla marina ATCC 23134]
MKVEFEFMNGMYEVKKIKKHRSATSQRVFVDLSIYNWYSCFRYRTLGNKRQAYFAVEVFRFIVLNYW